MGLAASQGRMLCLTARMSDLIYEAQQISQQKMALATQSQEVSTKYNDAMNNKLMQGITPDGGTQTLTYGLITGQDPFTGLCMRIVDGDGNVVVPNKVTTLEVTSKDAEGKDVTEKFLNPSDFINKYLVNLDADTANRLKAGTLQDTVDYYKQNNPNTTMVFNIINNVNDKLKSEDERYLIDNNCLDPAYLQEMISTGQWFLQQPDNSKDSGWADFVWQGSSHVTEIYDTSDDAAAEAAYETAMNEIQRIDKMLDLRLEQIQTQESACEKELESIKQVVNKNIETTFNTFSG